jgi:uridine kinase
MNEILKIHFERYPEMEAADAVKLIYQNEFGSAHMIADEASSLCRLEEEMDSCLYNDSAEAEDIGNGLIRLYLPYIKNSGLSLSSVNRMFIRTSKEHTGKLASFLEKLNCLKALAEAGEAPFSAESLDAYLADYESKGYPAASHSEHYKAHYHPAYRLIDKKYQNLLPLIKAIDQKLLSQPTVVAVIDGMAASGKSTAAELLSSLWDTRVIHMDDFFLPKELRTSERLNEPGGNVHYERFHEEVIEGIKSGSGFSYRKFDCKAMNFTQTIRADRCQVLLIEGAYSLHPSFGKYYDISAIFHVDDEVQQNRILKRNGAAMAEMFRLKWIPMEHRYFNQCSVSNRCDYIISGS